MGMLLATSLGDFEVDIVTISEKIINATLAEGIKMLKTPPNEFANHYGIWGTIESINNKVLPIACSLLALFFLIGFCENCIDVKEQLNLELCIKLFIRIGISEYFVVNSLKIVLGLFEFVTGLAGLSMENINNYGISVYVQNDLYDAGNLGSIVLLLPVMVLFLAAIATAAVIIITVFMRFIRILIAVPYGTLAFSTISSGSHWLNGTVSAFLKYMLSVLLEAFSLGIALSIGLKLVIGKIDGVTGEKSVTMELVEAAKQLFKNEFIPTHFTNAIFEIAGAILSMIMLLVLIRTSQKIAGKVLALDR